MTGKHVPNVEDALFAKDKKVKNAHKHLYSGSKQKHAKGEQINTSKPTCYRCGEVGLMKSNCWEKIMYKRCGKPGHILSQIVMLNLLNQKSMHHMKPEKLMSQSRRNVFQLR